MKTVLQILCFICLPLAGYSQDLSGLWKGSLHNDSTGQDLSYEVYIARTKKGYTGYSLTRFLIEGQSYYGIKKLKIDKARDGKIIMKDEERLSSDSPVAAPKDVHQLNVLDLADEKDGQKLSGVFVTNNTKKYRELTGMVSLIKINTPAQSDLVDYLQKEEATARVSLD